MTIGQLIGFSTPLKETYPFIHELVEAFRGKDTDIILSILAKLPEPLDEAFGKNFKTFCPVKMA